MSPLEESVVITMDGSDPDLYPFLPYILQDIWEIGSTPAIMVRLIRKHFSQFSELNVLDLGCGKGAVSIRVASELGCFCYGIDAVPEFILFARHQAHEHEVGHLCQFEVEDMRNCLADLKAYDIIILGAIGPVFGNYYETLSTLSPHLKNSGAFLIDDGYVDEGNDYFHALMPRKEDLLDQVDSAGMKIVDEETLAGESLREKDEQMFYCLKKRCSELAEKYPDRRELFENYVRKQVEENEILEQKIICTTMVIKKK